MAITSVRFYFYTGARQRDLQLTAAHWGFAEWFTRRLKPLRETLRGPEAKGVDIVNLMLHEHHHEHLPWNAWYRSTNVFQFNFRCDLRPLVSGDPADNVQALMQFYAALAAHAPWPQVRALAPALDQPLSAVDRITLKPYLQWPRGEMVSEAKARRMAGQR